MRQFVGTMENYSAHESRIHSRTLAFSLIPPPPQQYSNDTKPPSIFIFGVGYVGLALAISLQQRGWKVCGLTSSKKRAEVVRRHGVTVKAANESSKKELGQFVSRNLAESSHIISTVAPIDNKDPVLHQYYAQLSAKECWFGYLSSTSVYGDHEGGWVTEESQLINPNRKGLARIAAEREWESLVRSNCSYGTIFRLAGIYGPGRSALRTLLRQPSVLKDSIDSKDMLVSRIHVDDIVEAITVAATTRYNNTIPGSTSIFNIADDQPASRAEVFEFARNLLITEGVWKIESQKQLDLNTRSLPNSRDVNRTSKRVSNDKLKQLLLSKLQFPTYREGLSSLVNTLEEYEY